MPPPSQLSEDHYDGISAQLNDDESMDRSEIGSESFVGEEDMIYGQQSGPRKRKRGPEFSLLDQQHTIYADALLDYFMLSDNDRLYHIDPPQPPDGFMVNRPIDDQGHTALHWGAAMGDIDTIRMFINRGARINAPNVRGETPLIRAVLFTNNYEKETMPKLVDILLDTIMQQDRFGATVLHHVAMTTKSNSRKKSARYYLNVLLTRLGDLLSPQEFARFLEIRDDNGDTAVHIVARYNARKCVRIFLGRGVNVEIPNNNNETATEILQRSHAYRVGDLAMASSSPVQPTTSLVNGHDAIHASKPTSFPNSSQYETQSARSFNNSFGPSVNDKALQLTLTMEDELQQMDASIAEATRLIEQTVHERNLVRQRTFQATIEDSGDNGDEVRMLSEKNAKLMAANESLLEQEQHLLLHREVRLQEANLPADVQHQLNGAAGTPNSEADMAQKIEAAHALANAQARRRSLCKELISAQALAGMSEKGELYKRLIASSMNVPPETVVDLVPEILEELEVTKGESNGIVSKMLGPAPVAGMVA